MARRTALFTGALGGIGGAFAEMDANRRTGMIPLKLTALTDLA